MNFLQTSYELLTNFVWSSYKLLMNSLRISYKQCLLSFYEVNLYTLSCKLDHFIIAQHFPRGVKMIKLTRRTTEIIHQKGFIRFALRIYLIKFGSTFTHTFCKLLPSGVENKFISTLKWLSLHKKWLNLLRKCFIGLAPGARTIRIVIS